MITASVRIDAAGVLEHLHAVDAVHAEVGDHDVEAARSRCVGSASSPLAAVSTW